MSLLKDKRIAKLLAQVEEEGSSSSEEEQITFSSKFSAFSKKGKGNTKKSVVENKEEKKNDSQKEETESEKIPLDSSIAQTNKKDNVNVSEEFSSKSKKRANAEIKLEEYKSEQKSKNKSKDKVSSPGSKTGDTTAKDKKAKTSYSAPEKKPQSEKKTKKAKAEEDDDQLLNDLLGEGASEDGDDDGRAAEEEAADENGVLFPAVEDDGAVLSMLTVADVKGLDYRTERIKSFGKDSVPDVSGDELRRNGIAIPKIKKGPFVTPNLSSNLWHTLGRGGGGAPELRREAEGGPATSSSAAASGKTAPRRAVFSVDAQSSGYIKAQHAFDFTINTAMGDINALLQCWQEHPSHLPMLLQLSNSFQVLGKTSEANGFMDLALHVAGAILSSGGFSIPKTPRVRVLPYHYPTNKPVFVALLRGMHSALRQGSAHTAFEMCKVLMSLDEEDPEGGALVIDVAAVRSREWLFLVELHHRLMFHGLRRAAERLVLSPAPAPPSASSPSAPSPSGSVPPTCSTADAHNADADAADAEDAFTTRHNDYCADGVVTALELVALPNLHFNAALARHMYSCNTCTAASTSTAGGQSKGSGQPRSKGNRTAGTAGQRALVAASTLAGSSTTTTTTAAANDSSGTAADAAAAAVRVASAEGVLFGSLPDLRALAHCIALFPQAALALAEAIEERVGADPWVGLTFMNEDAKAHIRAECGPARAQLVEEALARLSKLFAMGSKGMWKSTQHAKFLRDAAALAVEENMVDLYYAPAPTSTSATAATADDGGSGGANTPTTASSAHLSATTRAVAAAFGAHVRGLLGTVIYSRYSQLPEENVTGVFASAIPQELLEAAMEEGEEGEDGEGGVGGGRFERVTAQEARLMERYEAAFGPLDPHMRFAQRMERYGALLEEHVRAMGRDEGAVRMFLRTMLPWNDVREMALRRAFEEAGVEDPAVTARRMQRQYELDVMDRADALAAHDEDLPEDEW